MATNSYLKCEPIKGESTDAKHTDWIEVVSFNHGLSQPISGTSGTGGLGGARPDFNSFVITKSVDSASIDLNIFCAKGQQIDKVELEVCQETGEKICYLKYELEKAIIQSISISGGGSERPYETITFVYNTVSWTYTPVKDGSPGTTVGPKKWNLETNESE